MWPFKSYPKEPLDIQKVFSHFHQLVDDRVGGLAPAQLFRIVSIFISYGGSLTDEIKVRGFKPAVGTLSIAESRLLIELIAHYYLVECTEHNIPERHYKFMINVGHDHNLTVSQVEDSVRKKYRERNKLVHEFPGIKSLMLDTVTV